MSHRTCIPALTLCFAFSSLPAALAQPLSGYQWRAREASDKPLTPSQRWNLYTRNSFASPGAISRTAFSAAATQISNRPEEWTRSWGGFGRRLGTAAATFASRDAFEHGAAALTGRDPRYQRCGCTGVWKRVGHSFAGLFMSANRDGQLRFDPSHLAAAYAGGYVGAAMYPDNYTFRVKGQQLGHRLAAQAFAGNLLAEFGPEFRRLFPGRKAKRP